VKRENEEEVEEVEILMEELQEEEDEGEEEVEEEEEDEGDEATDGEAPTSGIKKTKQKTGGKSGGRKKRKAEASSDANAVDDNQPVAAAAIGEQVANAMAFAIINRDTMMKQGDKEQRNRSERELLLANAIGSRKAALAGAVLQLLNAQECHAEGWSARPLFDDEQICATVSVPTDELEQLKYRIWDVQCKDGDIWANLFGVSTRLERCNRDLAHGLVRESCQNTLQTAYKVRTATKRASN
jgi:hypothetical protein